MDRAMQYIFWLIALISPIKTVMFTIGFLIMADFITGAYAAIKNKERIQSTRIAHTVSKFFIYNLVILSTFLLEEFIVKEIPFQRVITGFIAITEIKSILENFDKIYGVNPFKALVNFIKKSYLKDAVTALSKKDKKTTSEP